MIGKEEQAEYIYTRSDPQDNALSYPWLCPAVALLMTSRRKEIADRTRFSINQTLPKKHDAF